MKNHAANTTGTVKMSELKKMSTPLSKKLTSNSALNQGKLTPARLAGPVPSGIEI